MAAMTLWQVVHEMVTESGLDPKAFRRGLATKYAVTVEEVDRVISDVLAQSPLPTDAERETMQTVYGDSGKALRRAAEMDRQHNED